MINLGLARVAALLGSSQPVLPWRAVHVAGTNGKGSVCAYLDAMLAASGLRTGRFTSPHLVDRWDCIQVDGQPVAKDDFVHVERIVSSRVKRDLEPTPFELLTATAFELFSQKQVEIGIVEVGLGGRLDATNVLQDPLATVISKIGLDHQAFLGNTLAEIAREKAGIIKPGVTCVVDGSNSDEVLDSIREVALKKSSPVMVVQENDIGSLLPQDVRDLLEPHQQMNLGCAVSALEVFLGRYRPGVSVSDVIPVIKSVSYPGRLQTLDIQSLTGQSRLALLDGAHNPQSADVLSRYVNKHLRVPQGVTWVLAFSKGKDFSQMLSTILQPQDKVIAVEFGKIDGMDWVIPEKAETIQSIAQKHGIFSSLTARSVREALQKANDLAASGPLVIAGSLYLVSDVLKLLRDP